MKGYKVFNPDWTCRDFQYEVGKSYEMDKAPICCEEGFHFCVKLVDCFSYYDFNPENKVAEIEAYGEADTDDNNKYCTNKIKIVRELSWEEVLRMVNTGKDNTGFKNSGNRNSGDWNSGDWNSGNRNSGNCNSGNRNSGDWNSGDWNSGDWNKCSFSNGIFNTIPPKIYMFNKPTNFTYHNWLDSLAKSIMNSYPKDRLVWIYENDMSKEEKEKNPSYKTTGGYLKFENAKEHAQEWWDRLHDRKKEAVITLPNFDADIFKKITGIEVRKEK